MTRDQAEKITDDTWPPGKAHSHSKEDIVTAYVIMSERIIGKWKYRGLAIVAIMIGDHGIGYDAAFDTLKDGGLKVSDIKNAKQLVKIYVNFVKAGPATIAWFHKVDFPTILLLNRATRKHGPSAISRESIFDNSMKSYARIAALAEC